jgi:hypothetical protein
VVFYMIKKVKSISIEDGKFNTFILYTNVLCLLWRCYKNTNSILFHTSRSYTKLNVFYVRNNQWIYTVDYFII